MNEQLAAAVTNLINKAVSTAEAASEFVLAELPDVVQQLLIWKAVESGLSMLLFVFINAVLVYVWAKYSGVGEKYETAQGRTLHEPTLTHDEYGDWSPHVIITGVCTLATHAVSWVAFDLDWLQILVAPKIYLIEYAAQLVK